MNKSLIAELESQIHFFNNDTDGKHNDKKAHYMSILLLIDQQFLPQNKLWYSWSHQAPTLTTESSKLAEFIAFG